MTSTRIERDPLGEKAVPADALYGIQTLRAAENFPISGLRPLPAFVDAVVWIKRSAALIHKQTGRLEPPLADAIVQAADEVLGGPASRSVHRRCVSGGRGHQPQHERKRGAGQPGQRAAWEPRGGYAPVHPNDHVNMAQSTNDVIPTAMRLAALATLPATLAALESRWRTSLLEQGRAFDGIIKSGRTHLQDATPIRLGQEFTAYGHTVQRHRREARSGGRLAARDEHRRNRRRHGHQRRASSIRRSWSSTCRQVSGLELREGRDRIQLMQSMGDVATLSGAFRAYVLDLNKIANDIRLLASGPRTGLAEIVLPAVQPGSSIMPGKVNPSIAEMVNQVCFQALGLDTTVAWRPRPGSSSST